MSTAQLVEARQCTFGADQGKMYSWLWPYQAGWCGQMRSRHGELLGQVMVLDGPAKRPLAVFVKPLYRRMGIGTELLHSATQKFDNLLCFPHDVKSFRLFNQFPFPKEIGNYYQEKIENGYQHYL